MARFFLDTNIVAYADDLYAPAKQAVALQILEQAYGKATGVTSLQVLQEYFVTATRKLGVAREVARRKVELLSRLELVRLDATDLLAAIDLQANHSFSFWDALIIQAALLSKCSILFSEDLQDDFRLGSLVIMNPFKDGFTLLT